jgi:hypothetical protein
VNAYEGGKFMNTIKPLPDLAQAQEALQEIEKKYDEGWFSNMGAILAVKAELGMTDKREAGLGMAPVCWLD